jgi:hypothetical protein
VGFIVGAAGFYFLCQGAVRFTGISPARRPAAAIPIRDCGDRPGDSPRPKAVRLLRPLVLQPVAMVTWDNGGTGMGGRIRTCGAHLVLLQKPPVGVRAKGLFVLWKTKPMIRAVHSETIPFPRAAHPHKKPIGLTQEIILAVTEPGDLVLDPCAGSFTTLNAAPSVTSANDR